MKHIYLLLIVGIALSFTGCHAKKSNTDSQNGVKTEQQTPETPTVRNTVHYQGTYKGTLPTASGTGVEVTIVLTGDDYTKTTVYKESADKPFENSGRIEWNEEGNTITLTGTEAPNKYRVEENRLIHLDVDGNVITGDLAGQYILEKQ